MHMQGRPQTIKKDRKDRDDRDRLNRKISIRKTEATARNRKYFNGNLLRATGTAQKTETYQKYSMTHHTLPTVFKMATSTELNTVRFIFVQKYDYLHNKFSHDYKSNFVRLNCWKKIGDEFGVHAGEAEKK